MTKIQNAWLGGLTVLCFIIIYLHFSPSKKMVYVDTAQLLQEYVGMQQAKAAFQVKSKVWQANVDTLMSEVQKSIKDYEKESAKMTKKERELSKELIRTKQRQLQDYQVAMRDKAAQEDQEMTQRVLVTVNTFITEFGQSKGYRIILGTTGGNIVYAEDDMNITEEVVKLLNEHYQ